MSEDFNPNEYASFKAKMPANDGFDHGEFQRVKDAMQVQPIYPHETMWDVATGMMKDTYNSIPPRTLPTLAGAAVVAPFTGGMSLPAALGVAGIGAGGGNAFGQLADRFRGKPAPQSPEDAATEIAKKGIENAMAEAGIRTLGVGYRFMKNLLPNEAKAILAMPAESIRRAIKNPKLIPTGGWESREGVERTAVGALESAQEAIVATRRTAGDRVSAALEALHAKTKGAKIFDLGTVARNVRQYMEQELSTANETVKELVRTDLSKVEKVLGTMSETHGQTTMSSFVDAKAANAVKKAVQSMGDYAPRGLPEITTEIGDKVYKRLGTEMRQMIEKTAKEVNHRALMNANKSFAKLAEVYDEFRPVLGTKGVTQRQLLDKVENLTTQFNAGGLKKALIEEIKTDFPKAAKHIDALLDSIAARAFTKDPAATEGSFIVGGLRGLFTPQNMGKGIKMAATVAPATKTVVKTAVRAGTIMSTPISAIPKENLNSFMSDGQ